MASKKAAANASSKKYVKMSPIEHVLARPGMYVGSIEVDKTDMWILNNTNDQMIKKSLNYVPGLFKIFDEILVNVMDHIVRLNSEENSKIVKEVSVTITPTSISVRNDGDGVDVIKHDVHNVYIPELVFGNMLTSTNYDDNVERVIGGQNGIGAKACNIYSSSFTVETVDAKRKLLYKQTFSDNMSIIEEPEITKYTKYPYTTITFTPDFKRFGLKELSEDMMALYVKRVYDLNAISTNKLKVNLNDTKLPPSSFEKYVDMYIGSKADHPRVSEVVLSERWKVCASYSENGFQQVSFVNGISTVRGGKHVDYITNQITKKLCELVVKRKKDATVKPAHIKEYLFVFINCTVVNPTFDSQSKETLTTPMSKFGSKYEVDDKFIEKLYKTGIVEKAISMSSISEDKNTKKTDGKKRCTLRGIPKLDDANWAGSAKSQECILILTEGDSAKTMAISGLSEVGRNKYGVFPLRGKVMNVKDTNQKKINENEEISNIKKILGLETNKTYENTNDLRYGKIMIMTDSDVDGSHIKGLLFNVFHSMWPSLMKNDGFITSMLTPIVKATKGKQHHQFYCLTDYENWKKEIGNTNSWEIKYYKGLGTSTNKEAKEYFKTMSCVTYSWNEETSNESIDMAFNKKRANDRKDWIYAYNRNNVLDFADKEVGYTDFIDKELLHFSVYNLERSIPSLCDGLKKSQRKIMFSCFKRKLIKEIKVAQLAGYVSEHGAYHHGETSLQDAIVGMAQDFVGSNNINLLCPNGQFGTRIQGGKDSASPRYIHTQLNMPIAHTLFHPDDNDILNFLEDDGMSIEPEFYLPTLPMILINGAAGIGTGFSTNIPCYNPTDIITNIKTLLKNDTLEDVQLIKMEPWYRGFTGTNIDGVSTGKYKRKDLTKIEVTELPIGFWTEDFKEHLEAYMDKNPKIMKDYESHYTEKTISFILIFYSKEITDSMFKMLPSKGDATALTQFESDFKMTNTRPLGISNMHLYDENGSIKKFASAEEILLNYYKVRLNAYEERKKSMMAKLTSELTFLDSRIKFILDVIEDRLKIMNVKQADVISYLKINKFPTYDNDSYDYLIKMPIHNLTYEKKEELMKTLKNKQDYADKVSNTDIKTMWLNDLDDFEKAYNKC
jgi:DNA topoisomerase-2